MHFEDSYTRRVEMLLREKGVRGIEVISIGVGGWGTDHALEALMREGVQYETDIVICQFRGNDLTDNTSSFVNYKKAFRCILRSDGLPRLDLVAARKSRLTRQIEPLIPREVIYHAKRLVGFVRVLLCRDKLPAYEAIAVRHWWEDFPIDPTSPYNYRLLGGIK